jgi:hypothetical protein
MVAVAAAVGGVVLGLVWYLLAPPWPLKRVEGGLIPIVQQPEEPVA